MENEQKDVQAISGGKVMKPAKELPPDRILVRLQNGVSVLVKASGLTGPSAPARDEKLAKMRSGELPVPPLVVSEGPKGLVGIELDEYNRRQAAAVKKANYLEGQARREARAAQEAMVVEMGDKLTLIENAVVTGVDDSGVYAQVVEGVRGRVHFSELCGGRLDLTRIAVNSTVSAVMLPTFYVVKDGRKILRVPLSTRLAALKQGLTVTAEVVRRNGNEEFELDVNGIAGILPFDRMGTTNPEVLERNRGQRTKVRFEGLEKREVEGRHGQPPVTKVVAVFSKA